MVQILCLMFAFCLYCWSSWGITKLYFKWRAAKKGNYFSPFFNVVLAGKLSEPDVHWLLDFLVVSLLHLGCELYFCYALVEIYVSIH